MHRLEDSSFKNPPSCILLSANHSFSSRKLALSSSRSLAFSRPIREACSLFLSEASRPLFPRSRFSLPPSEAFLIFLSLPGFFHSVHEPCTLFQKISRVPLALGIISFSRKLPLSFSLASCPWSWLSLSGAFLPPFFESSVYFCLFVRNPSFLSPL